MNIADVTALALALIDAHTDEAIPPLSYAWQPGLAHACGSCYVGNAINLGGQLEDADEYDDFIVVHEFGHYFVDNLSRDSSPGGSHRGQQVSPLLAYGEGLAYFWAAMVLEDPVVVDTFIDSTRAVDLEEVTEDGVELPELSGTSTGELDGRLREEVVAAIMWDALDPFSDAEPFDTVEIGVDGNMHILLDTFGHDLTVDLNVPGIDLADWLNAAACFDPSIGEGLASLANDRDFPWQTDLAVCSLKGNQAPFEIVRSLGGQLSLSPRLPVAAPDRIEVWTQSARRTAPAKRLAECTTLPCGIAADTPNTVVSVTGMLGGERFGASWVGVAAADELLGGQRRTRLSATGMPLRLYDAR
jgi:hypothetical protein